MNTGASVYFRVDARLVHATTMNVWVPAIGAQVLLIVDDEVYRDAHRRTVCELSSMGQLEVRFTPERAAGKALAACDRATVLALFSTIGGASRAVAAGLPVDRLNIGHVPSAPGRKEIHPAVHLGTEDLGAASQIVASGVDVFIQPLPTDPVLSLPGVSPMPGPRSVPSMPPPKRVIKEKLRVVNERGLHLRAAQVFAQLASQLPCQIKVGRGGRMVDAKSLLGLTTLAAIGGAWLEVEVSGGDASASMAQVRALFASGFGEGVDFE